MRRMASDVFVGSIKNARNILLLRGLEISVIISADHDDMEHYPGDIDFISVANLTILPEMFSSVLNIIPQFMKSNTLVVCNNGKSNAIPVAAGLVAQREKKEFQWDAFMEHVEKVDGFGNVNQGLMHQAGLLFQKIKQQKSLCNQD